MYNINKNTKSQCKKKQKDIIRFMNIDKNDKDPLKTTFLYGIIITVVDECAVSL